MRFNLDPLLIIGLAVVCTWQIAVLRKNAGVVSRRDRAMAVGGWLVAATVFVSPLDALSVPLFSARVAQLMVLVLVAAPLIARGLPRAPASSAPLRLWMSASFFFLFLWLWHMPALFEATLTSPEMYWTMHITLLGTAILLWRELLGHSAQHTAQVLAAGALSFLHMSLLGTVLAQADRPIFRWHLLTTHAWSVIPLQDQQLGGTLMWVPGVALFLWCALRGLGRIWESIQRVGVE
jgi:putative membrane protein